MTKEELNILLHSDEDYRIERTTSTTAMDKFLTIVPDAKYTEAEAKKPTDVTDDVAVNGTVNIAYLPRELNVSVRTIKRDLAHLVSKKLIQRVGSDKTGHWEIVGVI